MSSMVQYARCVSCTVWLICVGGLLHKVVSFPDDFSHAVGKNTSGNPPIPFWVPVCRNASALFYFNLTCDVMQDYIPKIHNARAVQERGC